MQIKEKAIRFFFSFFYLAVLISFSRLSLLSSTIVSRMNTIDQISAVWTRVRNEQKIERKKKERNLTSHRRENHCE